MNASSSALALALAALSFVITMILGKPLLRVLRHYEIGEKIRVVSPDQDFTKLGTPTMGGFLFILPVAVLTVLLHAITLLGFSILGLSILLPLAVMVSFALIGVVSDWRHIQGVMRGGLRARTKFVAQLVLALATALGLRYVLDAPEVFLPFYQGEFELGAWYVPFATLVIVATANAVNLTGGINGLPGMISATAFATYGAIALVQGQIFIGRFCFTLTGALLGFLWFNVKPASLIMGNTGTFALGATLAVVALMTGQWALLPLIAIIPASEAISVMLQVGYFRWSDGKRIFRMAPLHYHFELMGWSETQIVQRFWLINFLFATIGVTLALV